ncbi:MAG: hypothetical protein ACT4PP_13215 [Sporichthyaceae bacterium]
MNDNIEFQVGAAASVAVPDLLGIVSEAVDGQRVVEDLQPAIDDAVEAATISVDATAAAASAAGARVLGDARDAGIVSDAQVALEQAREDLNTAGQGALAGGTNVAEVAANLPFGLGIVAADAVTDVQTQVDFTANALLGQANLLSGGILGEGMTLPNLEMLPVLGSGGLSELGLPALGTGTLDELLAGGNVTDVDGLLGEDVILQLAPALGEDALLDLDGMLGSGALLGSDLLDLDGVLDTGDLLG